MATIFTKGTFEIVSIIAFTAVLIALFLLSKFTLDSLRKLLLDFAEIRGVVYNNAKRFKRLEESFLDQKKYNELYMQMVSDTEEHKERIKMWMQSDYNILLDRVNILNESLNLSNLKINSLQLENKALEDKIIVLTNRCEGLESQLKIAAFPPRGLS